MAQDFKAAFGLAQSDTGIATVDADGVALAAIQGLNAKLEAEVVSLRAELAAIRSMLATIAGARPMQTAVVAPEGHSPARLPAWHSHPLRVTCRLHVSAQNVDPLRVLHCASQALMIGHSGADGGRSQARRTDARTTRRWSP